MVLPSKSNVQPSFFSAVVSWFSAAKQHRGQHQKRRYESHQDNIIAFTVRPLKRQSVSRLYSAGDQPK